MKSSKYESGRSCSASWATDRPTWLRSLEPARIPLGHRRARQRQLVGGGRTRGRDVAQLVEGFAHGVRRHVGPHARLQHERSEPPAKVEPGAHAVGVALVLAQVEVDAAHELAAEDRVEHEQRGIVGRRARGAHASDPQLGLRGARARHDPQPDRRRPPAAAPARPSGRWAAPMATASTRRTRATRCRAARPRADRPRPPRWSPPARTRDACSARTSSRRIAVSEVSGAEPEMAVRVSRRTTPARRRGPQSPTAWSFNCRSRSSR